MIANPNITSTQQVKPADGESLVWACDQRDPRTLGPALLNDGRNLRYSDGLPQTRKGVIKPAWANVTSPANYVIGSFGAPYGAGVFRDPNGVEWQMTAAGGLVWRTRPGNAAVSVPLPPGVAIVSACRFVQAFNLLFLFRGRYLAPLVLSDLDTGFADLLPQYNGTSGGSLGGGVYQAAVIASGTAADQMSYGPYQQVASLTWAASVATCATVLPHGYVSGSDVTIKGASPAAFNGRWGITVVDAYTFTFALVNNAVATATGSILVTNNAYYWTALGSVVTLHTLAVQALASFTVTLTAPVAFTITNLTCPASFTITSLTHNGLTLTAMAVNHGLVTGETVAVMGSKYINYNTTEATVTVLNPNQFTYVSGTGIAPAGNDTTGTATGTATYGMTAVAVTAAAHGLTTGATVTIAGAAPGAYNGTFPVTVTSSTSFSYGMASNPLANGSEAVNGTPITGTPGNTTLATAAAPGHGLVTGDTVTISGATPAGYNAANVSVTVINSSTFTYAMAGSVASSPATGVITCNVITNVAGSATFTVLATAANHGFATGDTVVIAGASPASYNGTWTITVLSANTFTYQLAVNPNGAAGGSYLTAQTSRVLAGQTPDSNPNAWTRAYDILPNAETALFTQNLLLVPTAYEPSSTDNYATITGGAYSTVDYLVATNYLDYLHFQFNNEFRINQGTADEIVDLFAFGQGNVVILKGKSYWMLTGLASGNIASVNLQCMSREYGAAGPRSWAVVGSNAYFLSPTYGVVVIRSTDLGTILSVNVPLSAPIQPTINRIDWTRPSRMNQWDNKLYVAVTLKDGSQVLLVYDFKSSVRMGNNVWESGVMTQGWTPMDTGAALTVVEFWRLTLNGAERHFFLDASGYVNLLEEADPACGDQVAGSGPQGLAWAPIDSYALTRSYGTSVAGQQRPVEVCSSLATLHPTYSVSLILADANNSLALVSAKTRSNLTYVKPFTAAPWNATNVNDDWATPWRQDYRVTVPVYVGSGIALDRLQETLDTRRVSGKQGKSFQVAVENTTGAVKLVGIRISAVPGRNRRGILT